MIFWTITAGLSALVAVLLVSALRRGRGVALDGAASDMAVYRDQLKEVERDVERGVLTEADAEAVRLEVSRRLLDADRRRGDDAGAETRGGAAIAVALVVLCLAGAFGLYLSIGAPGYVDQPLAARIAMAEERRAARPTQAEAESSAAALRLPQGAEPEFLDLMEKLRAAVAERPDDLQGLSLLARNEARLGNYGAARAAQARLVEAKGEAATVEDRVALLDITVLAAGGVLTAEADALIEDVLARDGRNGTARYYLGLGEAQVGRADRAFAIWRDLWEESDDRAPWLEVLRVELPQVANAAGERYEMAERRGPSREDIAAASEMSAEDRAAMIRGMVEGLSERLATEGGPAQDWARLITALSVLGEVDRARAIAAEAETVFAGDDASMAAIAEAKARLP